MTRPAAVDTGMPPGASAFTPHAGVAPRATAPAGDDTVYRANWLFAAPLIALNVLLTWLGRAPGITTRQDDATYLLLARALRTGRGYVELFVAGHPAHAQYPPGYPTFLAVSSAIVGERVNVLIALNVLCMAAALALFYAITARRWPPLIALTALALAAINPAITYFTGNLLSEPLFTLLLIGTFALALRQRQTWWSLLLLGALAIAAAFTRTAGLSLLIALGAVWILERRWIATAALTAVGGGLGAAWLVRAAYSPIMVPGRSYIADAVGGARVSRVGLLGTVAARALVNGRLYLTEVVPYVLPAPTIRGTIIDNVVCVILLVVCGAFGVRALWQRARVVAVFLVVYGLLLLAWTWPVDRFLVPMLPFMLLLLVSGAFDVTRRVGGWSKFLLFGFTGLAIAFAAVQRDVGFLTEARACRRSAATTSPACYNADQLAFIEAAREVRRTTSSTAIVASQKPSTFYYFSGGREVVPLEVASQASTHGFIPYLESRNVRDLVLEHTTAGSTRIAERLADNCARLKVERAIPPSTVVFELQPHATSADSTASCAAVAAYRASETKWLDQIW